MTATTKMWTVSLEIPECAGDDPDAAVDSFIAVMRGDPNLWVYHVSNDTGEAYTVDRATGTVGRE